MNKTIENKILRQMLAFSYTGNKLYHDDGELQDNTIQPFIDFNRDSVEDIQHKMSQRLLNSFKVNREECN